MERAARVSGSRFGYMIGNTALLALALYRYALDTRRTRPLAWEPLTKFADGMRQTVAWYQGHDAWWRHRKSEEFWQFYERNYQGLPEKAIPAP